MKTYKVELTENIIKNYLVTVEATDVESAARAAMLIYELQDLTPNDYSTGVEIWNIEEQEDSDEIYS
jgi:hypothetical protein